MNPCYRLVKKQSTEKVDFQDTELI